MILLEGFTQDERGEAVDASFAVTGNDCLRIAQLLGAGSTRTNTVAYVTFVFSPLTDGNIPLDTQVPGDASNATRYSDYGPTAQVPLL